MDFFESFFLWFKSRESSFKFYEKCHILKIQILAPLLSFAASQSEQHKLLLPDSLCLTLPINDLV